MVRIYVFGDRQPLIAACRFSLGRLGYVTYTPPDVMTFLEGICSHQPDLIVVDLIAHGPSGLRLCRELNGDPRFRNVPTIIVATPALLSGIDPGLGHDDLLVEPFSPEEVEARVRLVQWRLRAVNADDTVQAGPLTLQLSAYQASLAEQALDLTRLEFELLKFLATHRGVVYTREMLLSMVWGDDYYGGTRTVDVHVRRLRAKLGEEFEHLIHTVRGVGYRFEEAI